jgi:hypothetical protein
METLTRREIMVARTLLRTGGLPAAVLGQLPISPVNREQPRLLPTSGLPGTNPNNFLERRFAISIGLAPTPRSGNESLPLGREIVPHESMPTKEDRHPASDRLLEDLMQLSPEN